MCVVRDAASGICPARFQQYEFSGQMALDIFNYYLDKYADATNFTAEFWLAECFSPSDPSYAQYLDAAYNTSCATDAGVSALLTPSTTNGSAAAAQQAYLWLLRQAFFCTENQDATPGMGCVCQEGKDCDPLTSGGHVSAIHTLVVALIALVLLIVWRCVVQTRQGHVVQDRQERVIRVIELNSVTARRAATPPPPASPPPQQSRRQPPASAPQGVSQRRVATSSSSGATQPRVYVEPSAPAAQGRGGSGSNSTSTGGPTAAAAALAASSDSFGFQ